MNFSNMRLGTKLISAFILVCGIGAVVSGIGIYNMAKINDNVDRGYRYDLMGRFPDPDGRSLSAGRRTLVTQCHSGLLR
jgi:Four helix bundle sensory module for signal transduction